MSTQRVRITQTLLSAWDYAYVKDDGMEDFLAALNREKTQQTQAMLDGIKFEGMVNACLDGTPPDPTHEWAKCVLQLGSYLKGSQQQVTLFKEVEVDGQPLLLHGVLDFLRKGIIFDTKFSKTYALGKYFTSPQTPMYFALVPEAKQFQYLICDGKYIYRERYWRDELPPIEEKIHQFLGFLEREKLMDTFQEKWKVKGE